MPHSARPPLRSSAKEEALPPIQPQSSNNSYFTTNNNNNSSPGAYTQHTQHTQVSPPHTHAHTRREEESPEHLSRFLAWKHQPEPPTAHPALAQAPQGSQSSLGSPLSPHSTLTPPPRRPPSARPLSSSSHSSPAQHLPPIDWDAHTHANTHTHVPHNVLSQAQSKSDVPTFSPQSTSTQRHLLAPLSPALSPEKLSFSPTQAHTQTNSPRGSLSAYNSPTQLAEAKGLYLDMEQCKTQPHTSQHAHTTPNTNAHLLRTPANTPVESLTASDTTSLDAHTLTLSPLSLSQPKAPTQPHTHTNPHIHPRTHTPHSGEKPQSAHSQRVLLPLSNREVERDPSLPQSPLTPSPVSPSPHNSERLAQLHTRPHAHSRSQSHNERTHLPEVGLSLSPEQRVPLSVSFSAETLVQSPTQSHTQSHTHTAHPPVHSRNTHSSALHRSHKEED